jgi:hypothetical protein
MVDTPAASSPTPTATPACVGDCDGLGSVSIDEVQRTVNIFLGVTQLMACPNADRNDDRMVTIDEVQAAVNSFLTNQALCPKVNPP